MAEAPHSNVGSRTVFPVSNHLLPHVRVLVARSCRSEGDLALAGTVVLEVEQILAIHNHHRSTVIVEKRRAERFKIEHQHASIAIIDSRSSASDG